VIFAFFLVAHIGIVGSNSRFPAFDKNVEKRATICRDVATDRVLTAYNVALSLR